jgi:hypothetical protein
MIRLYLNAVYLLTSYIKQGYFSPEQRQALGKELLKQVWECYSGNVLSTLSWALYTDDQGIFEQTLDMFQCQEWTQAILTDESTYPILHELMDSSPERLLSLITHLQAPELGNVLKIKDGS